MVSEVMPHCSLVLRENGMTSAKASKDCTDHTLQPDKQPCSWTVAVSFRSEVDGAVHAVRVSADAATLRGEPEDIERVRVCIEHALESASFGCSASGPVTVEATLCIGD